MISVEMLKVISEEMGFPLAKLLSRVLREDYFLLKSGWRNMLSLKSVRWENVGKTKCDQKQGSKFLNSNSARKSMDLHKYNIQLK